MVWKYLTPRWKKSFRNGNARLDLEKEKRSLEN